VSELCKKLKDRAKEVGLNITVEKTKANVQTRTSETLTTEDHEIVAVGTFKYLGNVINNTNDETEETKATILTANKAYSSLQTVFRSKQIQRNYKTRLYKTSIKPVLLWKCNVHPNTNGRTNSTYI
jgi:hypothetical protein